MKSLKPILYAGALVGVLDITAACIQVYVASDMMPIRLLQGVAGGLLGRGSYNGGFTTAILGLAMHFTMALTVATIFYMLSRRLPMPQKLSGVVAVGLLYGAAVFASITSARRRCCRGFAVSICIRRSYTSPQWAGRNWSFTCSA